MKSIRDAVYSFPTKSAYGFIQSEIEELLKIYPTVNMDKFNNVLTGITCMSDKDGNMVIYHCDIELAIRCGIENRDQTVGEWD